MNEIERKFLLAVEKGDLSSLKTILSRPNSLLDINCCDPLARNALIIAIDNENLEMVKLLIEAGIRIGDAILYAIDENFVEAVDLLLDHEALTQELGNGHNREKDREHSPFSADMTPLILSAHRNNFEIIKMLLDRRVELIPDPHDPQCDCKTCYSARTEDCLRHSRARINAYRALASPCLMALSSPDPLRTAFEMSAKLESLASLEPEYKEEYLALRAQCQTFATRLLDHTRTSKELEILLNYSDEYLDDHDHDLMDDLGESCCAGSLHEISLKAPGPGMKSFSLNTSSSSSTHYSERKMISTNCSMLSLDSVTGRHETYRSHMRLARLRLAIQCKQKTFCAHPNIQELLASMWYENLPGFRRKNPIAQFTQVVLIGLMFPVYSLAYLLAPDTQLGRYIKKPFIKFICHSASYITFLLVLILASQRVEAFYSWSSVFSLFSGTSSQGEQAQQPSIEIRLAQLRQLSRSSEIDESPNEIFKQLVETSSGTSARGLDHLIKIFDQLPASSKRRGAPPSPIELVILLWVLSLIWAEIKQIRALGMNYYKSDMWNTLDSVASGFYVATIILRIYSYLQSDDKSVEVVRERWGPYDPTLLSEGLFAAATIFSALKLVYIFSVNPYLGPLQISLGRMIVDIVRFSWIYILVLFSFACGINQLLWYYADLERHQCMNLTNYMLAQSTNQMDLPKQTPSFNSSSSDTDKNSSASDFQSRLASLPSITFVNQSINDDKFIEAFNSAPSLDDDQSKAPLITDDSCKTWRPFSNVFESSQTLFWATFGLVDLSNFDLTGIKQYTRFWALLMFGCYCFINVVVVLNLLIAMMNHSYVKISKRSDIEWKFARTRLWMSYFDTGSTVPAPFNVIPSFKSLKSVVCYLAGQVCGLSQYVRASLFVGKTPGRSAGRSGQRTSSGIEMDSIKRRERSRRNCALTASYRAVMRCLVRRYLVNEQRLLERKRELTEAKLNRWAKLNAFE